MTVNGSMYISAGKPFAVGVRPRRCRLAVGATTANVSFANEYPQMFVIQPAVDHEARLNVTIEKH
jgi:hypothetical protein